MRVTEYKYQTEVVARRIAAEKEEEKHDCENCNERFGLPCLKVYRCDKLKDAEREESV